MPKAHWSASTTRCAACRAWRPAGGEAFVERFTAAMNDDFGTPEACAVLFEMVREINRLRESDLDAAAGLAARLKELGSVLGVLQLEADDFLQAGAEGRGCR
jgi:cysteinyl-tRNA synthetase